jgi:hypothetical protein
MNRALDSTTHSARADMFQREASWRLGPDALEREGGEPADAPWWMPGGLGAQTATRKRSTAASSTMIPSPGPLGSATTPSPIASGALTTSSAR